MKYKEYVKAFKVLTYRLRNITEYYRSRLVMSFKSNLDPILIYNSYNGVEHHYQFFSNENGTQFMVGNRIHDSRITHASINLYYSIGHLMKNFTKEDFIKLWLNNAIGNSLYVSPCYKHAKLLDSNDTVESLCVHYDITHI